MNKIECKIRFEGNTHLIKRHQKIQKELDKINIKHGYCC